MPVVLNPHSPACACARCVRGEGERKREKERGNVERLSLPPLEFSPLHLLPTASLPSAPTRSPRAVRLHMRRLRLRVPRTSVSSRRAHPTAMTSMSLLFSSLSLSSHSRSLTITFILSPSLSASVFSSPLPSSPHSLLALAARA